MAFETTRGLGLVLALGLLLAPGCGDGGGGDADAGATLMDGGGTADDGGSSAEDAGVSASDGGPASSDAATTGPACGTRGTGPCARGTFCLFPDTECGRFDGPGSCTALPERCPDVRMPVCGCDAMTYANRCEAYGAGISVDYEGACTDTAPGSCDVTLIMCRRLPPTCRDGTYPEVNPSTGCWTDRCITIDLCECAAPADCPMGRFTCMGGRCAG